MYTETITFIRHLSREKAMYKDGELWTSLGIAVIAWFWMHENPDVITGIKEQFSDILTVSSILIGFVMTTLVFYGEVASGWSKQKRIRNVANKIIDWQVWSVICLLAQIAYTMLLHVADGRLNLHLNCRSLWFALLVFLTAYAGFQILNHVQIIWWAFRNSEQLQEKDSEPQRIENQHVEHQHVEHQDVK